VSAAVPAGNLYDKQGTANPVARLLVRRFERALDDLLLSASPGSVLEVGCGEGTHAERWASGSPERVVGLDLPDDRLASEWAYRAAGSRGDLSFSAFAGGSLPYADGAFDLVAGIEMLEHVRDPRAMLGELLRCARSAVLVSVPREPLWRALNLARGAYLRHLGNTPGHLHHWASRDFLDFVHQQAEIVEFRTPLPWTVVLARPKRGQSPSG
jgi:2-polyprenyl-3-methyl-5-hydroxy-6-metoxy-1,4-benzoquinol methylase